MASSITATQTSHRQNGPGPAQMSSIATKPQSHSAHSAANKARLPFAITIPDSINSSPISPSPASAAQRPTFLHHRTDDNYIFQHLPASASRPRSRASPVNGGHHRASLSEHRPSVEVRRLSRPASMSASRSLTVHEYEEKPRSSSSSATNTPLAGTPVFPPAWLHNVTIDHQYPRFGSQNAFDHHNHVQSSRPVGRLVLRAARDRLSCGNKSGALGRGLIVGWVLTTLGFIAAAAFWKGELFSALDHLSVILHNMGYQGLVVFGVLIFITTIPPLPLYSTLIVLSGYTFGAWYGFIASYIASLVGAVVVFVVSRTVLRDAVTRSLASSPTATSLLQIIPANPHLLLLIRIAPYPYNLLNVVLASAPSLSLKTYTACTAISLCKLILHTWMGAGIHDLSSAYGATPSAKAGDDRIPKPHETDPQHDMLKVSLTWGGIFLCGVLFVYLTHLAKRAIKKAQEETRDRERGLGPEDEQPFLARNSIEDGVRSD